MSFGSVWLVMIDIGALGDVIPFSGSILFKEVHYHVVEIATIVQSTICPTLVLGHTIKR